MLSEKEISLKIETYLRKNVELVENFNFDTDLFENRIIDSIGVIELVSFLENEFHISIPFETISIVEIKNVNFITQFVTLKLKK